METTYVDLEQDVMAEVHLRNTAVQNISWSGVTVTVKDRVTKNPKVLVDKVDGHVEAGQYEKMYRACLRILNLQTPRVKHIGQGLIYC